MISTGRKLQEECCEQWVSDAGKVLSNFARRFRFAYSLEHYNKFAGRKLPYLARQPNTLVACEADYTTAKEWQGRLARGSRADARATLDSILGPSYDEQLS